MTNDDIANVTVNDLYEMLRKLPGYTSVKFEWDPDDHALAVTWEAKDPARHKKHRTFCTVTGEFVEEIEHNLSVAVHHSFREIEVVV